MSQECMIAVYPDSKTASSAVDLLHRMFPAGEEVALVGKTKHRDAIADEDHQFSNSLVLEIALGATLGAALGALLGASLLFFPGMGPLMLLGPMATGAVVGGYLSAIMSWGVHETHVHEYEDYVAAGAWLLIVTGEKRNVEASAKVLRDTPLKKLDIYPHHI